MSPTSKALRYLEAQGYTCAITEKWNSFARIRQDLFGFIDILALGPDSTIAVQACADDGGGISDHVKKIVGHKNYKIVRERWDIWVMGFHKGGSKRSMEPRIIKL